MEETLVITIIITCVILSLLAGSVLCVVLTSDPPLLPTTAQQVKAEDGSDGCSPTDVNPPVHTQGEGMNILALPPPAVTQDEGGNTLVLPPLAVTPDESGNTLVFPPPGVTQNKYGYNSGLPHLQSSTLLPVYMDGSDG